jgi:beta-glucosidase
VGGRNGQSAVIGGRDLRQIHLPPVAAGVRAGVWGLMAAYNDIDGIPCCANPWLLKDYLRDELGFDGVVMADGFAVDRLEEMCGSIAAAGRQALLSGVEVSLWDEGFASLERYEDDEKVRSAVDEAVCKILELKEAFGLLPQDSTGSEGSEGSEGSDTHEGVKDACSIHVAFSQTREVAQELARQSLVSLKGDPSQLFRENVRSGSSVLVTGPFADDANCFLGDYSAPLAADDRMAISSQLRSAFGGVRGDTHIVSRPATTVEELSGWDLTDFDLIVSVVGGTSERRYTDTFASNGAATQAAGISATGGEGVDLADVGLPWKQDDFVRALRASTRAPLVSVVVAGRAHVLTTVLDVSDAVVWAGYPGQFGAQAVVDALLGNFRLSGRMPISLPRSPWAVPVHYNDRQPSTDVYKDEPNPILVPFGFCVGAQEQGCEPAHLDVTVGRADVHVSAVVDAPMQGAPLLFARVQDGFQTARRRELVSIGRVCDDAIRWDVPLGSFIGLSASHVRVSFMYENSWSEQICLGGSSSPPLT